jgi:hypothetical protein
MRWPRSARAKLAARLILELNDEIRARIDRRRIEDLTTACAALARRWQHLHAYPSSGRETVSSWWLAGA